MKKFIIFFLIGGLIFPFLAMARVGVGIGGGKIIVDEPLKAGTLYDVPPVTILNTGDEASDYEVDVAFHVEQQEIWPEREWFEFSPKEFYLEPGDAQLVEVRLNLPVKVLPGNYFAFIEGKPLKKATETSGGAHVGIAAASKFYFSVAPNNIFQGLYYRFLSLYNNAKPWSHVILVVVVLAILITIFKKTFKIQLSVGRKQ
jgi:hypothetical protein